MARPRKHIIKFTDEEVKALKSRLRSKKTNSTLRGCIQVLFLRDTNHSDGKYSYEMIGEKSGTSLSTVRTVVKLFAQGGLEEVLTLNRNSNSDTSRIKLDGRAEAKLLQIACGPAPEGSSRWTLRLLVDRCKVELEEPVSKDTIRRALKNKLRPHKDTYWCIPAKGSGDFVACMEDVLDVYERPYDADYPVVCMDELPYEMHDEAREPLPPKPGSDAKTDYEYVRCGTCSVFGAMEPLTGKCRVEARDRRTKVDLAEFLAKVADDYPEAKKIVLVWDNLNTHKMGSLYEAFEPEKARRISSRFEVHYTPKHGSWLNVAEILLNILTKQCLKRRLASIEKVREELNKWVAVRNARPKKVDWQFKTSDARTRLKSLYPNINILNQ